MGILGEACHCTGGSCVQQCEAIQYIFVQDTVYLVHKHLSFIDIAEQKRHKAMQLCGGENNNAITDGGVALPKFLLTIVMKFSNFKSLRISRNSKDSKKANIGSWRVRSRPSRLRRSGRY